MLRVGIGFDAHRFAPGRRLMLGGVEIPHDDGLAGHSDADVLTHAIMDALLGAAAQGDIGRHFPDGEAAFKDADSQDLLARVAAILKTAGFTVINVDAVVVLEEPKLAPHIDAMRARIASTLGIDADRVGVKATTAEGMGFTGRREGVAAQAVALLRAAGEDAGC